VRYVWVSAGVLAFLGAALGIAVLAGILIMAVRERRDR
jgi:hypothetical protein